MFSIARLYNSACSYSSISIRIYPIMMSIALHHYKILKEHSKSDLDRSFEYAIYDNHNFIILQKELEKLKTYSDVLRKPNRDLFNQMLQSSYKYSNSIDTKG